MKFYWEWVLHAPEAEGAPGGEGDAGGKKPEAEAGGPLLLLSAPQPS